MDRRQFLVAGAALAATGGTARAQSLAGKTVTIIYPFAAGSSGDIITRMVADKMRDILKASVVVENRTGAAARIGVTAAKNAAPDGRTILITAFAPMSLYHHSYAKLDYDPFKDFAPLSQLASFDNAIAVNAAGPIKTFKDFTEWLKTNPESRRFGSPGAGTLPHFTGLHLGKTLGVELTHVSYRGSAPAVNDVAGGHLPFVITAESDAMPLHRSGRTRIVVTTGKAQSKFLPDIPNLIASGVNFHSAGWYGAFAPAGTPAAVLDELSNAIQAAVKLEDVAKKMLDSGAVPTGTTQAELAAIQKADSDTWGPVIKASGFKPED